MNLLRLLVKVGIVAAASLLTTAAIAGPSPQSTNMRVFRDAVAIWESGDVAKLTQVVAPNYVGHVSGGDRDIAGLRARIAAFREQYMEAKFTIADQIASGDKVATRMTATAISRQNGKPVRLYGLNISRFSGGRIVEEWPVWEVKP
jgi:ketosteroid isomerase-like protein